MKLAIEESADGEYGAIHKAECKALVDGEVIGDTEDYEEACDLADGLTFWAHNAMLDPIDYGYRMMPCTGIKNPAK